MQTNTVSIIVAVAPSYNTLDAASRDCWIYKGPRSVPQSMRLSKLCMYVWKLHQIMIPATQWHHASQTHNHIMTDDAEIHEHDKGLINTCMIRIMMNLVKDVWQYGNWYACDVCVNSVDDPGLLSVPCISMALVGSDSLWDKSDCR